VASQIIKFLKCGALKQRDIPDSSKVCGQDELAECGALAEQDPLSFFEQCTLECSAFSTVSGANVLDASERSVPLTLGYCVLTRQNVLSIFERSMMVATSCADRDGRIIDIHAYIKRQEGALSIGGHIEFSNQRGKLGLGFEQHLFGSETHTIDNQAASIDTKGKPKIWKQQSSMLIPEYYMHVKHCTTYLTTHFPRKLHQSNILDITIKYDNASHLSTSTKSTRVAPCVCACVYVGQSALGNGSSMVEARCEYQQLRRLRLDKVGMLTFGKDARGRGTVCIRQNVKLKEAMSSIVKNPSKPTARQPQLQGSNYPVSVHR
jgi:hypothetical protein